MEAPSFWINLFLLLISQTEQKTGFPYIFPERLQFFEYEIVTVQCECLDGVSGWRVMRKFNQNRGTNSLDPCSSAEPSCTLDPAFEVYSGEYWCENKEGEMTNSINISITAGLVILEVPVQPVAEGSDLTLRCIHQETELHHIRDFYKNGLHLMTCYSSNMTIRKVSKADEGNYRCSISGAGESPDSRLAVHRALTGPSERNGSFGPSHLVRSQRCETFILQTAAKFLLVALLSAVIALIHYKRKQRTKAERTADSSSPSVRGGNNELIHEDTSRFCETLIN
ncbi:low affinity immunoglobulin gamma Fc region receptor III-like [Xiphophorus maculatus]|uniref:low affinity immunoglobulin gamma Fc region receptor III-like n=1 Tax=Xiphophorus maculatus TaxID=8083 RepID=UPI000C6EBF4E|nr:low affinity immunoglobulin gamma Fc region receptor III-like [Xiphophorus maculatus]